MANLGENNFMENSEAEKNFGVSIIEFEGAVHSF